MGNLKKSTMMLARVGFVLLVVFAFDACNAVGRRGAETSYAIAETTWESDYSANRAGNDEMEELADEDLLDLSETLGASGGKGRPTAPGKSEGKAGGPTPPPTQDRAKAYRLDGSMWTNKDGTERPPRLDGQTIRDAPDGMERATYTNPTPFNSTTAKAIANEVNEIWMNHPNGAALCKTNVDALRTRHDCGTLSTCKTCPVGVTDPDCCKDCAKANRRPQAAMQRAMLIKKGTVQIKQNVTNSWYPAYTLTNGTLVPGSVITELDQATMAHRAGLHEVIDVQGNYQYVCAVWTSICQLAGPAWQNKSMDCVSDKFVYGGASTTVRESPPNVMPMSWLEGNQLGTFLYSVGRQFA